MKQKDGIEKFIQENRRAFEAERPGSELWQQLQHRLKAEKESNLRTPGPKFFTGGKRWLSVAAILLLCVSMAAFVRTFQVREQAVDGFVPADLREAQAYYQSRISQQMDRIKSAAGNDSQDSILAQILVMVRRDAEYGRLRKALHENPGDQHVRAAFIAYYRSRLAALDRIEDRLSEQTEWNKPDENSASR